MKRSARAHPKEQPPFIALDRDLFPTRNNLIISISTRNIDCRTYIYNYQWQPLFHLKYVRFVLLVAFYLHYIRNYRSCNFTIFKKYNKIIKSDLTSRSQVTSEYLQLR